MHYPTWIETLKALTAAGFNDKDDEGRVALLATLGLTPETWVAALAEVAKSTDRGRTLATFIVTYGVLPHPLTPGDINGLMFAAPYARGLRAVQAAEIARVCRGGAGSWEFYLAAAGGDEKVAQRLADEAVARQGA